MLRAENLSFRRGPDVLFEHLDFVVHAGQRVAIAGRNGVGKSTLFQLILKQLQSDVGHLTLPEDWRVAHMQQEVAITERAALAFVVDGDRRLREVEARLSHTEDPNLQARLHSEFDDLGGYTANARAGQILHGLGFSESEFERPYAEFSGGWRIRLHLAQALMSPCDLLLLDEPTNHLDLEAIMWLEGWLKRFAGTVLVIAHDRAFLDACTDHTLYLSGQSGRIYTGNYSSCEQQRAEYLSQQQALRARRDAQAAHIQKFVDRFRAKASKAKQVQSRIKALERLQQAAVVALDSPYTVSFQDPEKASTPLFSLRDVRLGYDDQTVLNAISVSILPGDRLGVLGANGAGKSTLLKALVGDIKPMSGELARGQHCDVGYFAQHQLETLDLTQRPLALLTDAQPHWREQQCRDYLGRWGFDAGMVERSIATLSGGEKARLVLALIALARPAILILDEPTNHLDLDMRDALSMALQDYEGAVIIVSHDRILLEKTVDDFWVVDAGRVSHFAGDLDDYTRMRHTAPLSVSNEAGAAHSSELERGSRRVQRQERARQREGLRDLKNNVRRLERDMEQQTVHLQAVEAQLADTTTYAALPAAELDALLARAGALRNQLEQTEEAWLDASAALEAAET